MIRLLSHSPTLITVKEVFLIVELYYGIVCPWILDNRSPLINLNLSWRTMILTVVLYKFYFAVFFIHGFLVNQVFIISLILVVIYNIKLVGS